MNAAEPIKLEGDGEHRSVSAILESVVAGATGETVTVGEIADAFGERAFGFMLILFSLPNCVPMPPGVAAVVGWPVLVFGLQMAFGGKRPWIPGFLRRRAFRTETFRKVVAAAAPRLRRIEGWCRPRHVWAFGPLGDRLIGVFAVLAAISVLIPFPGTNFPPSIALVIMSIAVIEEDGVVLAAGTAVGLLGLAYTAVVTGTALLYAVEWIGKLFW